MKHIHFYTSEMSKFSLFIILTLLSFSFSLGYIGEFENLMIVTLLVLYIFLCLYTLSNINKHITLLVFLITFFTFLMGRIVLPLFVSLNDIVFNFGTAIFNKNTYFHIYLSLFIALLFVYLGYITIENKTTIFSTNNHDFIEISAIRKFAKYLTYITFLFALLLAFEKILFVSANGYLAYYLDYQSKLPYLIKVIGALFEPCVYLFLATLPTKSESKPVFFIYLLIGISYLGFGQRGGFILYFLFFITYLFIRNNISPGNTPWIGLKGIIALLISLPLLVSFLFLFASLRLKLSPTDNKKLMVSFLYQQGVSAEVIGYTFEFETQFPDGKLYSIGDIIDYFNHHKIAQLFLGKEPIKPQTIERALNDHSLDATLGYIVKPHFYLSGGGLGSSYIAEAWKDFGYFGIMLFSYIYGLILANIQKWLKKNIWLGSIGFIMFIEIIYSPRARAIKFLSQFFSIGLIITFLILYLIYTYKKKTHQERYNPNNQLS